MTESPPKIYTCEQCGEDHPWDSDFTDEDMRKEYAGNFPEDPEMREPLAIICDDCYKKLKP